MTTAQPADDLGRHEKNLGSSNWSVVQSSLETLGRRLRDGRWLGGERQRALESRIASLATHSKPQIRCLVAELARTFTYEPVQEIVTRLMTDPNDYVRKAAERTHAARVEPRDALAREHDDRWREWLERFARFETRYGGEARREARWLGEHYAELVLGQGAHEFNNFRPAVEDSLARAEAALDTDPAQVAEHLKEAAARVKAVGDVFSSLRSLVMSADPATEKHRAVDLVNQAVQIVSARVPEGSAIDREIDPRIELDVNGSRIVQVFVNLLLNALEACDRAKTPARVRVTASRDDRRVTFTFEDNGCGLHEEEIPAVFRLGITTKKAGAKIGLGLPLSRKIVESEHRGSLRMTSRPGHGTTVAVVLPLPQTGS